jgi:hypothetical protein
MLVAWRPAGLFALILDYAVEVARAQFQPRQSLLAIEGRVTPRNAKPLRGTAGRATTSAVCIPRSAISARNSSRTTHPAGGQTSDIITLRPKGPTPLFCSVTAGVEAAGLSIMGGVPAGGRPIDRGVDSVSGWPGLNITGLNISRWPGLNISRWPRLKHVVAVMMVTMCRFLSDCGARKADCQSDRSDETFDHGSMFSIERRQPIAASSTRGMPSGRASQMAGRTKER